MSLHLCNKCACIFCREEAEKARSAVKVIGKRPVQISFANKKLSWKQRKQKQSPAAASGVGSRDEDK